MADPDEHQDIPREVTLSQQTMATVMSDPELRAEMEDVSREHGNAGLIAWLDAHDLTWHAGGADPGRAFAEALGPDRFRELLAAATGPSAEQRAAEKRRAARKAQKKARRSSRRR